MPCVATEHLQVAKQKRFDPWEIVPHFAPHKVYRRTANWQT